MAPLLSQQLHALGGKPNRPEEISETHWIVRLLPQAVYSAWPVCRMTLSHSLSQSTLGIGTNSSRSGLSRPT